MKFKVAVGNRLKLTKLEHIQVVDEAAASHGYRRSFVVDAENEADAEAKITQLLVPAKPRFFVEPASEDDIKTFNDYLAERVKQRAEWAKTEPLPWAGAPAHKKQ